MSRDWLVPAVLAALVAVGAAVFGAGLNWGLPSREVDRYLFSSQPVWSGRKILDLAGAWTVDPTRGADVDADPLTRGHQPVCINKTDEQRAQIARRYRLFTCQPDEMVTMRALAAMSPGRGDFDPQLYQYGGLWVYPIGILLKLASMARLLTLTTDVAYYLDHPEAFARFYVVARMYTAAWALVGIWAVFWTARRLTNGCLLSASTAAACYIAMPAVVNMAHEAKPHLPGAVLVLLAVMAASRYVENGRARWWLVAAGLCGAAFGMVLTAWPVFTVLPVMVLLRRQLWRARLVTAGLGFLLGGLVYGLANPYVLINLFINRPLLWSNLGNTRAMFSMAISGDGLLNAAWLVGEGTSILLALAGTATIISRVIALLSSRLAHAKYVFPSDTTAGAGVGWLLGVPAGVVLVQFALFATGQPAEYGRFALLPDVALAIAAVVGVRSWLARPLPAGGLLARMVLATALPGSLYLAGFVGDTSKPTTRTLVADRIAQLRESGATTLAVYAEPAPYAVPPVDLFRWRILLLPRGYVLGNEAAPADVIVWAVDAGCTPVYSSKWGCDWGPQERAGNLRASPMSWAAKPFVCLVRQGLGPPVSRRGLCPQPK